MLDSIVKALTIQISADDLTGGAWSAMAKDVKSVYNEATALNQAWELAGKVYSKMRDLMAAPIEALSAGGKYAEARNGLENLAQTYGVSASRITDSIRTMADGSLGLVESTKAASDALRMGFSESQVQTIWEFADRYTHVMGGDVLAVAKQIEESIFTGRGKGVKAFGLSVSEGTAVSDIMQQLDNLKSRLGEGVFDFGDAWKKIGVGFDDMTLEISRSLNDLVGEAGFEGFSQSVIDIFRAIENEGPTIAAGIFTPLMDAAEMAWAPIKIIFDEVSSWLGLTFDNSDTLGTKITTLVLGLGNTFYDTARATADAWKMVLVPIDGAIKKIAENFDTILEMAKVAATISKYTGGPLDPEMIESLRIEAGTLKEIEKEGLLQFDTSGLDKRQADFNKKIMEASQAHDDFRLKAKEGAKGISEAGEAFAKADKEVAKHKETVDKTAKSYKDMGKEIRDAGKDLADSTKVVGQVIEEQQKGLNETAGSLADLYSGNYDSFRDSEKRRELESLMARQERAKSSADALLQKQVDAQIALAKALEYASTHPKVVEFKAPNDPNLTEAFVAYTIDFLVNEAKLEGTPIQA